MHHRTASVRPHRRQSNRTDWDPAAAWYDDWVGKGGSGLHREVAIPVVLASVALRRGEKVLDIGSGQGVLAPHIRATGAVYTGVDASRRLVARARKRHGKHGRFMRADATRLSETGAFSSGDFDAVVFVLSIQNMDPLDRVLESAAWALRPGGRLVMLVLHPCFRVPRLSGWGWDPNRKLRYRRVDGYLKPMAVSKDRYLQRKQGRTCVFHRPLQAYLNGLVQCGFAIDHVEELPRYAPEGRGRRPKGCEESEDIPMFLVLRARKTAMA